MLKTLCYLNIVLALSYFLAYLLNSFSWPIAGVIIVIFHNALVLHQLEKDEGIPKSSFISGILCLVFSLFLSVWVVNIIRLAREINYFKDSYLYVAHTSLFVLAVIAQFAGMVRKSRKSNEEEAGNY